MSKYVPILLKSTRKILQVLVNEENPVSADKIARYTKSSKRMVYYDLGNVKYLLKNFGAGDLENKGEPIVCCPNSVR